MQGVREICQLAPYEKYIHIVNILLGVFFLFLRRRLTQKTHFLYLFGIFSQVILLWGNTCIQRKDAMKLIILFLISELKSISISNAIEVFNISTI